MSLLEVKSVSKSFQGKNNSVTALSDVTFSVEEGEFVVIVGPTGCGKSTLLRIIAGLENCANGSTCCCEFIQEVDKRIIGMVLQENTLFPWLTVEQNITFSPKMRGISKEQQKARATELVELMQLHGFEQAYPHELSGGMQQRTAVAQALASDAQLLLLDEPLSALDDRTRHRLQNELKTIHQNQKMTTLMVTHDIDEAIFLGTRILIMQDRPGSIIADIPIPEELKKDRLGKPFRDMHLDIRNQLEKLFT